MKKLTLKECRQLATKTQKIVPDDMQLWKKVKTVTESQNKTLLAKVYERLGGRWKILESSIQTPSKFVEESAGPLTGTKHEEAGKDWARRLKEYDPVTYERFMNWD
jgi:hypothetical protein